MTLIRLRHAAELTLPAEITRAAQLSEGDYLEAILTEGGILLRPLSPGQRQPTPGEEAEIQAVVDEERRAYAAERRR